VGAILHAGSLIKESGGTLAPTGGYVAGRSELVEQACWSPHRPGHRPRRAGHRFDLYRAAVPGPLPGAAGMVPSR